jgi:threonine/homoserine/homoserine lactone efflux protein
MEEALLQGLVIASSGLFSVGSILIALLLLSSTKGPPNAVAYVTGYFVGYLLIGLLALALGSTVGASAGGGVAGPAIAVVLGAVFVLLGLKRWRSPDTSGDQASKLFASIDALHPAKALLVGMSVTVLNFKNLALYLSAVSAVAVVEAPFSSAALAVLLIASLFCAGVFTPVAVYVLAPTRSRALLQGLKVWLLRHSHALSVALLLLFGTLFLAKGTPAVWHAIASI